MHFTPLTRWRYSFRYFFFAIDISAKNQSKFTSKALAIGISLSLLKIDGDYMSAIQMLGLLAGSLTTAAFLPQVLKTWKSRSAKDLSLGMFLLFCLGVALWLVYGFAVNDLPVIAANLLTLILAVTLLFFKLRFKQ